MEGQSSPSGTLERQASPVPPTPPLVPDGPPKRPWRDTDINDPTIHNLPPLPPLPLFPLETAEFHWLDPQPPAHVFLWDDRYSQEVRKAYGLGEETGEGETMSWATRASRSTTIPSEDLTTLLDKATDDLLTPEEQSGLMRALDVSSVDLDEKISPTQLTQMTTHNLEVASSLFHAILLTNRSEAYLKAVEDSPLTMRMATMLARSSSRLPREFAQRYVVGKASACSRVQGKEERDRQVHIVCKLIQVLEKHEILSLSDLLLELKAFALEHLGCPEAVTLYQRLTSLK
ncbi:hypothetical protein BJ684DRAFT_17608 [Piptocephalis cylindrospora]|uniref:CCR4-NOT transcription complex subunit 11 n=1 Tax=Piptocephalis cylindrospora TaxID=1907219 RepID=A0A4V1IXQ1_9FUNG|nr:hypothetical protein BJ684DRAFT_17608 [Piptocephalis cylindrospora]|eukprot:RKP11839.1 hypothetical protein BJ684DRAFT_17608 [Piptocephalis cylindrospora]